MGKVYLTPLTREDLYQIWHFIAIDGGNPQNADSFIARLDKLMKEIARSPRIGIVKNEYSKGLMQFPVDNYLIFYFPLRNGIQVVRILHGMRDIPELF